ncbi:MAG: 2,3-bisphosphoglycerate-independent phosphoglycerate mutase [Rhodospirillaceae bacterium]|nr:2,3-bisphosphoglycerate-independent phosphoglycerate mutase [Rhodospirillaceae bacterium]
MTSPSRPRPIVLCILDGWGHREDNSDNAVALAHTPVWRRLWRDCPHALLQASELNVGLPSGQMGNSEVGHMNLGAGRVVMQDLPRIDLAVADGSLATNPSLKTFIETVRKSGGKVHLMGLMSPGGVHSHHDHILALARILADAGLEIALHVFLDGRDTPPKSAREYLSACAPALRAIKGLRFGTVAGRYYAMDRDRRWERTKLAYDAMVDGQGETASDPIAAIGRAYAADITDEFVRPAAIAGYRGMSDGDGLLMANFRSDRTRQILTALLVSDFDAFPRAKVVRFAAAAGLSEYSSALGKLMLTMFAPRALANGIGEIVARAGLRQLRIAETEKYAHVTFFFNGGEEREFPGEERILVPSPRVATYDLKPEMSAPEVTDRLVEAITSGRFDLIVANYANTDMVGHTGDTQAAIKAVEAVDAALGRLETAIKKAGGAMFITADHGNAETMREATTGEPHTAHTLNPVPAILVNAPSWVGGMHGGQLADVAPTLLSLFGIPKPSEMTGRPLFDPCGEPSERNAARAAMVPAAGVADRAAH